MSKQNQSMAYLEEDDAHDQRHDRVSLFDLASFLKSERWFFVMSISMLLSANVIGIVSARSTGWLVEKGLIPKNVHETIMFAGLILLLELVQMLIRWGARTMMARAALRAILHVRHQLFLHLQKLPMQHFDRWPEGRTVTRMTHDVEGLEQFFSSSMGRMVSSFIMIGVSMVAMLAADIRLGGLVALAMLPALVVTLATRRRVRTFNAEVSKKNSAINSRLSEYMRGMDVVRLYGLEDWSRGRFDSTVVEHLQANHATNRYYGWTRPLISSLCYLPLVVLVMIGGPSVAHGTLNLGLFIAMIRYTERFSWPIMMLAREIHLIQQAFTQADRIANFLRRKTEDDVLITSSHPSRAPLMGAIDFQNVSMSYDGKSMILRDCSFTVRPGSRVGIVGTTGSGKTTTVALMARLYDYQEGDILIDGVSIRDIERDSLRKQLGFISQDVVLFKGSLRDNLLCDKGSEALYPDRDLLEAAEKTGLWAIMQRNGLTLDSLIFDEGQNLSTGEKQLVSITRVLLRNPRILIMDEATANIDEDSERLVHDAVSVLMQDRTCLMIAHRLNTLASCERIFVFSEGRVVEQGTHDELMLLSGRYASMSSSSDRTLKD